MFTGAAELFQLVGELCRRPRRGDWPKDVDRRPDSRGLPILWLVRPASRPKLSEAIRICLEQARPHGVRHARLELTADEYPDVDGLPSQVLDQVVATMRIRRILAEAVSGLTGCPRVRGRAPRFEGFLLLDWLMSQSLPSNGDNPERELRRRLQDRWLGARFRSVNELFGRPLNLEHLWWRIVVLGLRVLTWLWFTMAITGRVPLVSGRYRWFMTQPHVSPGYSGSFVRFAFRITADELHKEGQESLARLLVNTFLEDLRREYRLRPWQLGRARPMTYPVLLLDNITTGNGGVTLLRLINDVRNQTGLFDPLLVIGAGSRVPPSTPGSPARNPVRTDDRPGFGIRAWRAWQGRLQTNRRARLTAWYLAIRIPDPETEDLRDKAKNDWDAFPGFSADKPIWWTSRWTRIGAPVIAVVLAVVAVSVVLRAADRRYDRMLAEHCGTEIATLITIDDECIGVSDGSYGMFDPGDKATDKVVQTIRSQNRLAERMHREQPLRPYITLVDLEAYTAKTRNIAGVTPERESLEGLAVSQHWQLTAPTQSEPIVRILLANGGAEMHQGPRVAGMLKDLAEQDPTIVGVVGLDMSNRWVEETIRALTRAGLPMVATTLSADGLADNNPMYFQLAPQNRRQAEMVAAFAAQLPNVPRVARIYYPDEVGDTYTANLRDDAEAAFRAQGFRQVSKIPFIRNSDEGDAGGAAVAGRDICGFDGVAFFAGRGIPDFGQFLNGAARCGATATVIANDDGSRLVADEKARRWYSGIPYYYVSFITAPAKPDAALASPGLASEFDAALRRMFDFEQEPAFGRFLDGHAALGFDAAGVLISAVKSLWETSPAPIPITSGTVWRQITTIHGPPPGTNSQNFSYVGVTGTIDYGDITRNVSKNKPLAIFPVEKGEVVTAGEVHCGRGTKDPPAWCPQE